MILTQLSRLTTAPNCYTSRAVVNNSVSLNRWCAQEEDVREELSNEYYLMEVGRKYSKAKIAKLQHACEKHAFEFLKQFKEPRSLYMSVLSNIVSKQTYKSVLKLHDVRKKKICSKTIKFQNHLVCWTNWRQFVTTADDKSRKQIFDEFITKVPVVSPLIQHTFDRSKTVLKKYGEDPLSMYVEEHKMSLPKLKDVLEQLGSRVKRPFQKQFSVYTNKFLGRGPEYYDDFYYMRNKVFEDLVYGFKKVNPLVEILKTSKTLGFSTRYITVDAVDRPEKYPSPFCSFIRTPTDIRVSYKNENPLNTTTAIYHEFGHALHASSIRSNLPYWTRNLLSEGLCETFSVFFEGLIADKEYMQKVFHFSDDFADELMRRIEFTELFAIAFYVANSFFKIEYWEKPLSFAETNGAYARHIKRWMGMDIPGAYWQLHHILPEALMYVPSYMLANIRAHEVRNALQKDFGYDWWSNPSAGDSIKQLMSPGADSVAGNFSKINPRPFLDSLPK